MRCPCREYEGNNTNQKVPEMVVKTSTWLEPQLPGFNTCFLPVYLPRGALGTTPGPPTAQVHPPIPLMEQGSKRLLEGPCNAQAEVWNQWSQGEEVEAESKWLAQGLTAGRAKLRVPAAHSPRSPTVICS